MAERTAVSLGCAIGATTTMEAEYAVMSDCGKEWLVDASYSVLHLHNYFLPSSLASEVAIDAGSLGVATVVSNGCTSGIDAVGNALELIRESEADVVITGGADAPISPITLTCFDVIKATSPYNDDPATSCRPFDRTGLAWYSAKAPRPWCSKNTSTRRREAPGSTPRWLATRSGAIRIT